MNKVFIKAFLIIQSLVFICALVSCDAKGGKNVTGKTATDESGSAVITEQSESGIPDINGNTVKTEDFSVELDKIMSASLELYDNISFTAQKYKYDGKTMSKGDSTTAVLCEKGWVIYANDGSTGGLFINEGKKYYSINVPAKTKKLIAQGASASTISWDVNISTYSVLMTEHKTYTKELYTREGSEKIADRDCVKYKVDGKNLSSNPEIEYWFDIETGLVLKAITKMHIADISSINQWEITKFAIGAQSIDEYIDYKEAN